MSSSLERSFSRQWMIVLIQPLCQVSKFGFRVPVRKVGERMKLRLDVLRRNGSGDDGKDVVFKRCDFHHASSWTRVGHGARLGDCSPASGPAITVPPEEISAVVA
ncbi:hypothetical protein [Sinorhizobium sp. Sb3]|uniref:hypothetical protein n=1 Tax=Sinorhizobium sp. Sb3 TaxID=1358417 RepID=UPI0012E35AF3|nr:hypothetical protein [Sinorhizobium sp. Sb3]